MSRHTPGPWLVRVNNLSNYSAEVASLSIRGKAKTLARCARPYVGDAEANACLIAAAPRLLSDLRIAAHTLRRYEELHRAKGTAESDLKAQANAALAAAFEETIRIAEGESA